MCVSKRKEIFASKVRGEIKLVEKLKTLFGAILKNNIFVLIIFYF